VRLLLLVFFVLVGCEQPCALVCQDDSQCVGQGAVPGFYCLNNSVCLQDCYRCNGGNCVDTFHHCGACGVACAPGKFCSRGSCTTACAFGESPCDGSCYDLANDRTHCGDCNHACARDQICVNNACSDTICG
jgi:hypothetical protein